MPDCSTKKHQSPAFTTRVVKVTMNTVQPLTGCVGELASRLTLIGGLIQLAVALSLLFLPVFVTCQIEGHNQVCQGESYIQRGGNTLGYTFLISMIVTGVIAVVSSRAQDYRRVFLSRWLVVLTSVVVVVVAGFGFGIAFAPGALTVLVSALLTRPAQLRQH
jgi:hypothetical protein